MEYISPENSLTANGARILCCQCAVPIEPNPSNMCVACLRAHVDISEGIPKQATLFFCRGCERYLQPPAEWVVCALESRELLALCLKRLKGLNRVKLVDAGFAWTEPHSKRIKVRTRPLGTAALERLPLTRLRHARTRTFIYSKTSHLSFFQDLHKCLIFIDSIKY